MATPMAGLEPLTWSFGPKTLLYMELSSVLQRDTFLPRASGVFLISVSEHWILLSWPGVLVLILTQEQTEQWPLCKEKSLWALL